MKKVILFLLFTAFSAIAFCISIVSLMFFPTAFALLGFPFGAIGFVLGLTKISEIEFN